MKKLSFFIIVMLLFISNVLFAQVGINADNSAPDPSAMLDVKSSTKGALLSRMTKEQIGAISSPTNGLVVFCTDDNKFYAYIASAFSWNEILYGTGTIAATCGSLTIDHVAGVVAPVTKTVTYSTVKNIAGELGKCWITSNLGADHQATDVNDATEASSGWYWQFNRKQGYKHDGSTRTPNTTWISSINENSDWIQDNDPCMIELGTTWRLPTSTEWTNVDASGGWTNWSGPWGSALKMHAAGYLEISNGGLSGRGSGAWYCCSSQVDSYNSSLLDFNNVSCLVHSYGKAYGWASRCLRD